MISYKKKKGIIYVNDCKNAQNLYNLMKKQNDVNVYIYISKNVGFIPKRLKVIRDLKQKSD